MSSLCVPVGPAPLLCSKQWTFVVENKTKALHTQENLILKIKSKLQFTSPEVWSGLLVNIDLYLLEKCSVQLVILF